MYKALVVSSSLAQAEEFHRYISGHRYHEFNFYYPSNIHHNEADLHPLFLDCCKVIEEEEIELLITVHPGLTIVQAALVEKYPKIKGATIEAAFLCFHRYYNKKCITYGFTTTYSLLNVADMSPVNLNTILDETLTPAIICDTYMMPDCLYLKIKNAKSVYKDLHVIKSRLTKMHERYVDFLQKSMDVKKYKVIFDTSCMIDQYCDPKKHPISIHYVEACVANADMIPWAISDVTFWENKPRCIQGVNVPTILEEAEQFQTWAIFRELVQRLLPFGFNNQFIHAKVVISKKSGQVRIIEVAGCLLRENIELYRHVYQGGDNLHAQLELSVGNSLWQPKLLSNKHAMRGLITTFQTGEAGQIMDFKAAKHSGNIEILVNECDEIESSHDTGTHLANAYACSDTYEHCVTLLKSYHKEMLRDKDFYPWAIGQG